MTTTTTTTATVTMRRKKRGAARGGGKKYDKTLELNRKTAAGTNNYIGLDDRAHRSNGSMVETQNPPILEKKNPPSTKTTRSDRKKSPSATSFQKFR